MQPTGRKSQNDVTFANVFTRQNGVSFNCADAKPREIIIIFGVHAGHLGGFAANQGTACTPTAFGDSGNDVGPGCYVQLCRGEVIQEKKGLGPLYNQIVNAHRDEVDADGVMPVRFDGDFKLGADAIGSCDKHWIFVSCGFQVEHGTESTKPGSDAIARRRPGQRLDRIDQGLARIDVYACILVTKAVN